LPGFNKPKLQKVSMHVRFISEVPSTPHWGIVGCWGVVCTHYKQVNNSSALELKLNLTEHLLHLKSTLKLINHEYCLCRPSILHTSHHDFSLKLQLNLTEHLQCLLLSNRPKLINHDYCLCRPSILHISHHEYSIKL